MASPAVTVVLSDGRKLLLNVAAPMPADLVAFEAEFNVSAEVLNGEDKRVTWSLFIVWRLARRAYPDIMNATFPQFVELVEDLIEGDDEVMDPTEAVPHTA